MKKGRGGEENTVSTNCAMQNLLFFETEKLNSQDKDKHIGKPIFEKGA
jgi:hypothetical protein